MKIVMTAAAIALLASSALADPIYGTWRTIKDDNGNFGDIKVSACGAKICGVLTTSYNGEGNVWKSPNDGKNIIWDMQADGGGAYSGGKVWAPDRDKTYNSRLELNGTTLSVKGCVLGICRSGGTWTRVN
ncbi:DUF2147 domain-containing protein [Planktotalea arctica]|uniref:DUF2147 domain-containing protein n=1 Tax=Planktotalea arctica TaxID=1481893 RepID=UPI000A1764E2|nr:DUF2147 domain-containing protein [Planktotalea arctica]